MSLRIRRRRFGQLAIGSAAATAITTLAGKTVAQSSPQSSSQSSPGIIGVSLSTTTTSNLTSDLTNIVGNIATEANNAPGIVTTTVDVNTGNTLSTLQIPATTVNNKTTSTHTVGKAVSRESSERLTAITSLSNGTLITVSVLNSIQGDVTRLIFSDPKSPKAQTSLKVSGFQKSNSTVESLLATKDDTLIAVVSQNEGIPPFQFVTIDRTSGQVNSSNNLGLPDIVPFMRLTHLTQSSDGTIYATTVEQQGVPVLVQIDLKNKSLITGKGRIIRVAPLILNNKPLQNDVLSLAFSPSDELFVLANTSSEGTNFLHTVDVKTGTMTQLRKFAVDQITFTRA